MVKKEKLDNLSPIEVSRVLLKRNKITISILSGLSLAFLLAVILLGITIDKRSKHNYSLLFIFKLFYIRLNKIWNI